MYHLLHSSLPYLRVQKCAHKTIQLIRGWAKKGDVNVVHYLYILEAELAMLNGKNKKAKEKFKAAISASSRNGFLQDRALAHVIKVRGEKCIRSSKRKYKTDTSKPRKISIGVTTMLNAQGHVTKNGDA